MNDETLILYYYKDGLTRRERGAVAGRLATDPAFAERYRALCETLEKTDLFATAGPSSDMVQRWHDAIDGAADSEFSRPRKPSFHLGSFFWGAVVTAAIAVGIGIGIVVSGSSDTLQPPPQMAARTQPDEAGAFFRGLQVHLRETGEELTALPVSSTEERRSLILKIIGQNRLFEHSAERNQADDIARILRAFELVLMQLATEDISAEESAALQSKLLFEMNVVLTKLAVNTSNEPDTI